MPSQDAQDELVPLPYSAGDASKNLPDASKDSRPPSTIACAPSTSLFPAYVALAAASQLALENHRIRQQDLNDDGDGDDTRPPSVDHQTVSFSRDALALINILLDQLLYDFLAAARSTTLYALRPAIQHTLKGNLARQATASAELELKELLAGSESEDELEIRHAAQKASSPWNLDMVWKRTRLRLMVYTRLGEMEDDEEERHLQREQLAGQTGTDALYPEGAALVTWTAAIYLTSILEFIAERCIAIAGQAAFDQCYMERRGFQNSHASGNGENAEQVVVENHHVERLALDPIVGRTWRTYRQTLRSSLEFQSSLPPSQHAPPTVESAGLRIDGVIMSDSPLRGDALGTPTGTYLNYRPAANPENYRTAPASPNSVEHSRNQPHAMHETKMPNNQTLFQRATLSDSQVDGSSDTRNHHSAVPAAPPVVSEKAASNNPAAGARHADIRLTREQPSAGSGEARLASSLAIHSRVSPAIPTSQVPTQAVDRRDSGRELSQEHIHTVPDSNPSTITSRDGPHTVDVPRTQSTARMPKTDQARKMPLSAPLPNSNSRSHGLEAREARGQSESTRSLACFVRSSGPVPDQHATPLQQNNRMSAPAQAYPSKSRDNPARNSANRPSSTGPPPSLLIVLPRTAKTALQPREPRDQTRKNEALIAFLREGPPGEQPPPSSAPYPNDQQRAADKNGLYTSMPLQTNRPTRQSIPQHSTVQPTTNNRDTKQRLETIPSGAYPELNGAAKKRSRVRDPYALPDSDDDADDIAPTGRNEQESLVDFLKSVPPPHERSPAQVQRMQAISAFPHRTAASPTVHAGSPHMVHGSPQPGRDDATASKRMGAPLRSTMPADIHVTNPSFMKHESSTSERHGDRARDSNGAVAAAAAVGAPRSDLDHGALELTQATGEGSIGREPVAAEPQGSSAVSSDVGRTQVAKPASAPSSQKEKKSVWKKIF